MDKELNYAVVTFMTDDISTHEKLQHLETIYDEVKTEEQAWDTNPPDDKKAPLYTLLHLVAAALGIICIILVSVIIGLSIHFREETSNLTAQNLQLWTKKVDLERQIEELTREKDGLNWTIGVILEYENFPVNTLCPQKVCKPCLEGWVLFQSSCYLFTVSDYYSTWKTWEGSQDKCRQKMADLVVIESQEEEEFIKNHTKKYNDEKHGYWIGLSKKNAMDTWMWVDGSNLTVMFWKTRESPYRLSCVVTLPHAEPLASWQKVSCDMRNRWICETRALIKESATLSKLII